MRDVILLLAAALYMAGGYFVVGKVGDFIDKISKTGKEGEDFSGKDD